MNLKGENLTKMAELQTTTQHYNKLHIPNREEFHRKFGGTVYQSDFNTDYRGKDNEDGSHIAARIESDYRREMKIMGRQPKNIRQNVS